MMRLIYIAGPYSASTAWGRTANVHNALALAQRVAGLGADLFPITPHVLGHAFEDARDLDYWYEGTLELMRRCDAVLTTSDWLTSKGAVAEVGVARELGLPVFLNFDALQRWAHAP